MVTTRRSGVGIHYVVEGSGPPLVLLHGGGTSSDLWRIDGYVDALSRRHALVLVDLRGHGQSDKPHDRAAYRPSSMASDVLAVLDDLGLGSAIVCGMSLGAGVALRVAACHPERVSGLAAIGSDPEPVGFADLPVTVADDDGMADRFEQDGMGWMAARLEAQGRSERARLVAQADPFAMAAWNRAWSEPEPIPERLVDLSMPSLFAWGEQELEGWRIPPLPAGARVVVVPGADHIGSLERPDVLIPALLTLSDAVASATGRPASPA